MWLFDHIKAEWATVVKAPFLLLAVLALGAFLGWTAASTFYEQDLQTLRDQLAPYLLEQKAPVVKAAAGSPSPTPTNSDALLALNDENATLRAENDRLKRIKAPHVATALRPSACPSTTLSLGPSKLSADDCDDLTRAQQLWDNAEENRMRLVPSQFGTGDAPERYAAAAMAQERAGENLQRLEARLCTERKAH